MIRNKQIIDVANSYFQNDINPYLNIFNRYLQYGHNFFLERAINKYCMDFNKYPDSILDIGCGTGAGINYLKKRIPNCKVIGIDPSLTMINESALTNHANVFCTDLYSFTTDLNFDIILSYSTFRFWLHPIEEIIKASKLLSDKGLFYLLDVRRDSSSQLLNHLTENLDLAEKKFILEQFASSYSFEEANKIVKATDIHNVKIFSGIPELYDDNQTKLFNSLDKNDHMSKSLIDLNKGFAHVKAQETVYSIILSSKICDYKKELGKR